jgi:hypothetical protein
LQADPDPQPPAPPRTLINHGFPEVDRWAEFSTCRSSQNAKRLSRIIKQVLQTRSQDVPLLTDCLIPCCAPVSEREDGDEQASLGFWCSFGERSSDPG